MINRLVRAYANHTSKLAKVESRLSQVIRSEDKSIENTNRFLDSMKNVTDRIDLGKSLIMKDRYYESCTTDDQNIAGYENRDKESLMMQLTLNTKAKSEVGKLKSHGMIRRSNIQESKDINKTHLTNTTLQGSSIHNQLKRSFSVKINKSFNKPQIQIGGDFTELVTQSSAFADKSLFIKEILENSSKVTLITMPRRWGKSSNLDMLRRLLEVKVDNQGKQVSDEVRKNSNGYKLFFGNGKSLLPLDIAKEKINIKGDDLEIKEVQLEDFCCSYPVIFIDFKDCKGSSYSEVFEKVKSKMLDLYGKHSYLTKSEVYFNEKTKVSDEFDVKYELVKNGDEKTVKNSPYDLSSLLQKHFGKRVYILIDEYDAPINEAFMKFKDSDESDKVMDLFRSIFEPALKGNEYLEKGVMTGVNRIAKASLFSGLNNLTEYNFQSSEMLEYYGLNDEEVDILLDHFKIKDQKNQVKDWYNGYKGSKEDNGRYNIWSVINFLNKTTPGLISKRQEVVNEAYRAYWVDSGGNFDSVGKIFGSNEDLKNKILDILKDQNNFIDYRESFGAQDFRKLREVLASDDSVKVDPIGIDLVLSYLTHMGYFVPSRDEFGTKITVANNEIKTIFISYLKTYYERLYKFSESDLRNTSDSFKKLLINGDSGNEDKKVNFTDSFDKLFAKADISKINEHSVHDLLFVTCAKIHSLKVVGSDIVFGEESSKKRSDLIIFDQKTNTGIIIEIKHNRSTQEALKQIDDRKYKEGFSTEKFEREFGKVSKVIKIGFNMNSKEGDKKVESQIEIIYMSRI